MPHPRQTYSSDSFLSPLTTFSGFYPKSVQYTRCPSRFLAQNTVFLIFLFLLLHFKSLLYIRLSIFISCFSIRLESPFWSFEPSSSLLISGSSQAIHTAHHCDNDVIIIHNNDLHHLPRARSYIYYKGRFFHVFSDPLCLLFPAP